MNETIILSVLLGLAILVALYYRGNLKIRKFILTIEAILRDEELTVAERIDEAKGLCRQTKGIVSFAIHSILEVFLDII